MKTNENSIIELPTNLICVKCAMRLHRTEVSKRRFNSGKCVCGGRVETDCLRLDKEILQED